MLAYCGIECYECPAYKATLTMDKEALEETGKKWGVEGDYKAMICLGCKGDNEMLMKGCTSCGIRPCAIEKGMSTCAVCSQFDSCAKIQGFLGGKLREKMEFLRSKLA